MINWFDMPAEGLSNGGQFEIKELEVTENGTYETKGEMYNKVTVNVEGGGGDLTWILPEQTVTLVDQPVEITGLLRDLIPASVRSVPLKLTETEFGSDRTNYFSLTYLDGAFQTEDETVLIYAQDGKDMFAYTDGEDIKPGTYTISIALF